MTPLFIRCTRCNTEKPSSLFSDTGNRGGKRRTCQECKRVQDAEYYQRNRELRAARQREYYQRKRAEILFSPDREQRLERVRNQHRQRKYGLTPGELEAMEVAQHGKCAICGGAPDHKSRSTQRTPVLVVDHDHKTNKVRGLLCNSCNTLLGMAKDNPERLRAACLYLERAGGAAP